MLRAKKIAQTFSMVKSGNMRNNSIHAYKTPQGFRLVQKYNVAFYGSLLDTRDYTARSGSLKGKSTRGWWTVKVFGGVRKFLYDVNNGQHKGIKNLTGKVVKKPTINSTFTKSIPRG